ncbi:MAG TPA: hypothetical protein VHU86_00185 [Solirubrobacterales bacterium]|jgi:hypothetical protein|nr:hypothetical protein [Solirubrobacterales bacterium]
MDEATRIACSLNGSDLRTRQQQLAQLGGDSLIGRNYEGGRHLLRFRADRATRSRLDAIVRAEGECCPFLVLTVQDEGAVLTLSIEAPEGGEPIAAELAGAFA